MNPFLGLPVESGKCESCGTSEHGKCEGHFGYINLPIPIYHPSHVIELKRILSLVCLKCLRIKKGKMLRTQGNKSSRSIQCLSCQDVPSLSITEGKTTDGAIFLELKLPSRSRLRDGFWNFLNRYGFPYGGDASCRSLLPAEALKIMSSIPEETKRKLSGKGYFPQNGFILESLPVPPNCLSVPDISDGTNIMSSDISVSMLRKVLNKVEIIKRSRSGIPNFESHEIEANDLQLAVSQYMHLRGTPKVPQDMTQKFGVVKEGDNSSTKAWLEKMRTLFIRKGSGFSSRSVITGDAYRGVNEIGIPIEIAQKITFEEKVTPLNLNHLQELVDNKLCVTYRDGSATYAIREGSKGHTYLKVGQVINRRIMDGDIVFINRPPSTHKHSLQAFSVYVHDDHTVKINPLICGPLGADFDGDCVHIFYPQSLAAKAEVVELFSVEKQMISSHSGSLNLQLVHDSLLSLKLMFNNLFLKKATAQQLSMHTSPLVQLPALVKAYPSGPSWTYLQLLETVLPSVLDFSGERHLISQSEIMKIDFNRDLVQSIFTELITFIFDVKGPKEALKVFNLLQPLLMEVLFQEGYSIGLNDFDIPKSVIHQLKQNVQDMSPLLYRLRCTYDEVVELEIENHLKSLKLPLVAYILKSSSLGNLIDSKSDSAITKVVQQIGFLGLQLFDHGKFYSKGLVEDLNLHFQSKCHTGGADCPSEAFGLIRSSFIEGLNPYEAFVHSISSREVLIRSSRGLTEPGVLFKNLMAILRDVVICYDGTIRHSCGSSIIQFEYGLKAKSYPGNVCAGEPVGVLAATAISNPAYKAVLDSSQSNNSSWELMKEILLCKVNFKNDVNDRKVILYLNDCCCGKKYCKENAACLVQSHLQKARLKDFATDIAIEYQKQRTFPEISELDAGLVGHIHIDKKRLKESSLTVQEILQACQDVIHKSARKKNPLSQFFKSICLSASECCCFEQQYDENCSQLPCLQFTYCGPQSYTLEKTSQVMADVVCPLLLETIVKGDSRVKMANIIWIDPDSTPWVRKSEKARKGELALEVVVEKDTVKQRGDAWRIVLDCCLPVMNLINTKRSIPYGVQQIQELLGISCAFDQSVQRLSTAMRMVTKGVLVEHLMLVASSMTYTGNLIGFNAGGFKALFRSLQVQVPFTEATLFRPMKCFERAAEKCHVDSLSSIVASCSWGKHVAIGTGTRFQLLWNEKEANYQGTDVYNFLQLVRTTSDEKVATDACLGVDVDNLQEEFENMSPEHNSEFEKATFDYDEILEGNTKCEKREPSSSWGKASAPEIKSGAWDVKKPDLERSDWGSWNSNGASLERSQDAKIDDGNHWNGNTMGSQGGQQNQLSTKNVWNTDMMENQNGFSKPSSITKSGAWDPHISKETSSKRFSDGWGAKSDDRGGQNSNEAHAEKVSDVDGWNGNSWGAQISKETHSKLSSDGWGAKSDGWGGQNSTEDAAEKVSVVDGWNDKSDVWSNRKSKETESQRSSEMGAKHPKSDGWVGQSSKVTNTERSRGSWAAKSNIWGDSDSNKNPEEKDTYGVWNRTSYNTNSDGWGGQDSKDIQMQKSVDAAGGNTNSDVWGSQNRKEFHPERSVEIGGMSAKSDVWGSQVSKEANVEKSSDTGGWNANIMPDQLNQQPKATGWGSTRSPGWGSSNNADRKNPKSRFSKPPGKSDDRDGRNSNGILTATGKRLDMFTSEEEKVLSEVEPLMLSMKRIMHNSSYSDGDRLSAEDQSFVLDNIFQYHPDKASKMGAEVNYFMVDKHSSFQETRCLYVVSTDDFKADFSYRKCMENFVKTKHPEVAEAFIRKYFIKRRADAAGESTQQL